MRRAGFTLIELLVVVAIIAVLAGILIPVLMKAREAPLKATCIANMRLIGNALAAYKQDYGVYPATLNALIGGAKGTQIPSLLTCPKDPIAKHDTYGEFYNYYGYTPGNSAPTPLTSLAQTEQAYTTLTNPNTTKADFWRAGGDAQDGGPNDTLPALINNNCPANTIITACPHHSNAGKYLILRVDGAAPDFRKAPDTNFWALSAP